MNSILPLVILSEARLGPRGRSSVRGVSGGEGSAFVFPSAPYSAFLRAIFPSTAALGLMVRFCVFKSTATNPNFGV